MPRRALAWVLLAYLFGLFVAPLTSASALFGDPDAWLVVPFILGAMFLLGCCWLGFALATHALLGRSSRDTCGLTVLVLLPGSTLVLLPDSLSLPAHGWPYWLLHWLILAMPYPLIAAALCPGLRHRYRAVPLAALLALAIAWPSVADGLTHSAAETRRAQHSMPADMYLAIDLPGYEAGGYDLKDGVVSLSYDAPGESFMATGDDLVLNVFPANGTDPCLDPLAPYLAGQGSTDTTTCKSLGNGQWLAKEYYGGDAATDPDVTLIELRGSLVVAMTVSPQSDAPVAASRLPALFKTLHSPGDRELLAMCC